MWLHFPAENETFSLLPLPLTCGTALFCTFSWPVCPCWQANLHNSAACRSMKSSSWQQILRVEKKDNMIITCDAIYPSSSTLSLCGVVGGGGELESIPPVFRIQNGQVDRQTTINTHSHTSGSILKLLIYHQPPKACLGNLGGSRKTLREARQTWRGHANSTH